MNQNNQLAIIMSVYKGDTKEYVEQAINSLRNQSYQGFDIYLCIDGSIAPDLDTYLQDLEDNNLHIYRNQQNLGLAKSMNILLNDILPNPQYKFIARTDADDINIETRLEKQIDYLKEHPDIDCLGTGAIEITASGEEYFKKLMPQTHEDCFVFFKKRDCMIHPTVMFRREYFAKAGLYPEDTYFGEDTIMWAKGFAAGCKFANIPEYLYFFRLNEHFFERRRGWKHAKSILQLRHRVNKMLHYGLNAELFALLYALAKMMPTSILNIIYKIAR